MQANIGIGQRKTQSMRRIYFTLIVSVPIFAATIYLISVKQAISQDCPIVIDLNGNKEIDVGGFTTTQRQIYTLFSIPRFVEFDLQGGGKQKIDWLVPNTDGFLLDVRRGTPPKEIDGSWLFANFDGAENGFAKLKEFDTNADEQLTGEELVAIKLWIDNGDALFETSEMKELSDYQIVGLPTESEETKAPYGGIKMTAYAATLEGDGLYMEDVWFLNEGEVYEYDRDVSTLVSW
ncbi:hypothetical protein [Rhizobium sp. SAFR-030]|uniref:hypothetical protein n=1 Tax=Rhizobium sp. SAFR-030 TaxID=3387277 RepID=UPI003F7F9AB5